MREKTWNLALTLAIVVGLTLAAGPSRAVKAKAAAAKEKTITAEQPTLQPAKKRKIRRSRPRMEKAQESLRKTGPPPTVERREPREMVYKPTIESVVFQPADGGAFGMGSGVLAPRGRLILRGRGFGTTKSVVIIDGLPGGYIVLENLQWANKEIRGTIPLTTKGKLGTRYAVVAKVIMPELADLSNAYPLQFEHPSEIRALSGMSRAVLPHCGTDGNANQCNAYKTKGDSCVTSGDDYIAPPGGTAIYGFHSNCSGAIGDDSGVDRYDIKLLNGWIIREIVEVKRVRSSSDERVVTPSLATGRSNASLAVNWKVTPGDHVRYWYKVKVIGPLGTSYGDGAHFGGGSGGSPVGKSYDPSNPNGRGNGSSSSNPAP